MWMLLKRNRKLWIIYLFLIFFGIYLLFCGTKSIINTSTKILADKLKRVQYEKNKKISGKNGLNVIVGHYIGTGNLFGNITNNMLNANDFSPIPGEGENGKPVIIPAKDILKMQQLFQINRFNLMASDRISLNRSLPDVRRTKCINRKYDNKLPTTTIIIVFHNEAWSVLLRTVWSVITRSPKELLKEIILVDDASDRVFLQQLLDDYSKHLPVTTRILRLPNRKGLVAARLLGAKHSTGDTLTFLDAHCECSTGWLEPLMQRIKNNSKKIACPVIDIISDDNFGYIKSFEMHWGAFNWQLHFRWFALDTSELQKRKDDITQPFFTPAMAGGLFSIDRNYFYEIGSYDSDMEIWGGDNLEMSFRIWQCGGEIEIIPCSHVGHLFRKSSPYTFPGGVNEVLNKNLARVAMVWMDQWSNFFFKFNTIATKVKDTENVTERQHLRENLNCKSFDWYLKTIWKQNFFPASDRYFGKILLINYDSDLYNSYRTFLDKIIINEENQNNLWKPLIKYANENLNSFHEMLQPHHDNLFCLVKSQVNEVFSQPFGKAFLRHCENTSEKLLSQMFVITTQGKIMTDENVCLDVSDYLNDNNNNNNSTVVRLVSCSETPRQVWKFNLKTLQIKHSASEYCLEAKTRKEDIFEGVIDQIELYVKECELAKNQAWILLPFPWK